MKLGKLLISVGLTDRAAIANLVAEPFLSSGALSPQSERVFENSVTIVQRRKPDQANRAVARDADEFAGFVRENGT